MRTRFGLYLGLLLLAAACPVRGGEAAGDETGDADATQRRVWEEMARTPRGLFFSGRYEEALRALGASAAPETVALRVDILLETGRLAEAEALFADEADARSLAPILHAARARVHAEAGRYAEALDDFCAAVKAKPDPPAAWWMRAKLDLADLYFLLGNRDAWLAETDWFFDYYGQVANEDLSAEAAYCIGMGAVRGEDFRNGIKVAALAQTKDPTYLPAFVAVGDTFLEKYQYADARREYEAALRLNPHSPAAHAGLAGLFARDRDFAQVEKHCREALAVNPRLIPAHLLLAMLEVIDEDREGAIRLCDKALALQPRHPEALRLRATLEVLPADDPDPAATEWAQTLLALPAGLAPPDEADDWTRAARESVRNVRRGRLLYEASELVSMHHRIKQALALAQRAVEADPENAAAQAQLGVCLMRHGREEEAAPVLAAALELDPFNVWVFNLRKLLQRDMLYETVRAGRLTVKIFNKDAPILRPYLAAAAEKHLARCETLYGFQVKEPVTISMLKSHADFSARVTGLPHLDASGASFGPFVALVSPRAARLRNNWFNWDSVLLHELAHVVTLHASDYRVPRWLTEGMSVHAEGWITPEWDAGFKSLVVHDDLPSLASWNAYFNRPGAPWRVAGSYMAAGLFVRWFAEQYGDEKLPLLLREYRAGRNTATVFETVTGDPLETIERWFHGRLKEYARHVQAMVLEDPRKLKEYQNAYAKNPDDLAAAMRLLRAYRMIAPPKAQELAETLSRRARAELEENHPDAAGRLYAEVMTISAAALLHEQKWGEARSLLQAVLALADDFALGHHLLGLLDRKEGADASAETHFRRAIELYPRFTLGNPNPYFALAGLYRKTDRCQEAVDLLRTYTGIRRDDPEGYRLLAECAETGGDETTRRDALEGWIRVDPYVRAAHAQLAELLKAAGETEAAARERAIAAACPEPEEKRTAEPDEKPEGKQPPAAGPEIEGEAEQPAERIAPPLPNTREEKSGEAKKRTAPMDPDLERFLDSM